MTRSTGHNGFFNDSPNSSNNRNTPMCFICGEQGHMRHKCETKRVFCTYCKSSSHSNRACRKLTTSPTNSHVPTEYHPTAIPPPLSGNTHHSTTTNNRNNQQWTLVSKLSGHKPTKNQHHCTYTLH